MSKNAPLPSLGETAKAFGDVLSQGTRLGMSILEPLVRSSAQVVGGVLQSITSAQNDKCDCDIPPPCWEPQRLGEVTCFVCPGGTATIRLRVTNCNWHKRQVQVTTSGQNAGVKIDPPVLILGPMERGIIAVSLPTPANAGEGEQREVLIFVRGCKDHFLRWIVKVTARGIPTCCDEVEVEDCPDNVHHWYDHFYCQRPCTHAEPPREG
jgi:hypothetical protein